jgi:hypothetical protein
LTPNGRLEKRTSFDCSGSHIAVTPGLCRICGNKFGPRPDFRNEGVDFRGHCGPPRDVKKVSTAYVRTSLGASDEAGYPMGGISWTDLDPNERRAIAMLAAGISVEFCDPAALLTLISDGVIRNSRLTPAAEELRRAALLHDLVA